MRKNISLREMILLGLLIVAAVYLFAVQGPITRQTEAIEARRADVDAEMETAQMLAAERTRMLRALEETGDETPMPAYNNMNSIILELNTVLGDAEDFSLTFGTDDLTEGILRRDIRVNCMLGSYDTAVEKMTAIGNSGNGYLIRDAAITEKKVTVRVEGQNEERTAYALTMDLTGFEYAGSHTPVP